MKKAFRKAIVVGMALMMLMGTVFIMGGCTRWVSDYMYGRIWVFLTLEATAEEREWGYEDFSEIELAWFRDFGVASGCGWSPTHPDFAMIGHQRLMLELYCPNQRFQRASREAVRKLERREDVYFVRIFYIGERFPGQIEGG